MERKECFIPQNGKLQIDSKAHCQTYPIFGELKLAHDDLEFGNERTEHKRIGHSRVFVGKHVVEISQECERRDRVELPVQLIEDESFHSTQVVRCPATLTQLHEVGRARNGPVLLLDLRGDVEAARGYTRQVSRVGLEIEAARGYTRQVSRVGLEIEAARGYTRQVTRVGLELEAARGYTRQVSRVGLELEAARGYTRQVSRVGLELEAARGYTRQVSRVGLEIEAARGYT